MDTKFAELVSETQSFFDLYGVVASNEDPLAQRALTLFQDAKKEETVSHLARAVLDGSFIKETELVESEFEDREGYSKLLKLLYQVHCLVNSVQQDDDELVETIHWRYGALHYMFLMTVKDSEPAQVTEEAIDTGIRHLGAVCQVRKYVASKSKDSDQQVEEMISAGIWSDTHALARAYLSELTFMGWEVIDKKNRDGKYYVQAKTSCEDFVNIVEKYLATAGWNADKQKSMLATLLLS